AVDVTDVAEGAVRRGGFSTLIGDRVSVDDLATGMGTIGYEVLTDLGRRDPRLYKGGGLLTSNNRGGAGETAKGGCSPGRSTASAGKALDPAVSDQMARRETTFICQPCGAAYSRWQGKCDACGQWNTIAEESFASSQVSARGPRKGRLFALEPLAGAALDAPRLASGLAEFDRVTGGG